MDARYAAKVRAGIVPLAVAAGASKQESIMGSHNLAGMLEVGSREQALRWHLQSNHYPPISLDFIGVAEQAIEDVDCGYLDNEILMPNGRTLTAAAIVDGLHLGQFLG